MERYVVWEMENLIHGVETYAGKELVISCD
jgi:hypothetical protein